MELDSDEAVTWFTSEKVRRPFLEKLHPAATIRPCSYNIVVQFIPLTFRVDKALDLRELEEVNGLQSRVINRVRWIKPVARRHPSQTCGHIILTFSAPSPANDMLVYGLFICHKKVYAEKCKKEPLRCLKCHNWGHMVAECTSEADVCGTCSQHHRTADCDNTDHLHCVSCGASGHSSWDRSCPVFQCKCKELNEQLEDNSMPYFPTEEEWMQVKEPPKTVFVMQPPGPAAPAGGKTMGFRQTTLPWASSRRHEQGGGAWADQDGYQSQHWHSYE